MFTYFCFLSLKPSSFRSSKAAAMCHIQCLQYPELRKESSKGHQQPHAPRTFLKYTYHFSPYHLASQDWYCPLCKGPLSYVLKHLLSDFSIHFVVYCSKNHNYCCDLYSILLLTHFYMRPLLLNSCTICLQNRIASAQSGRVPYYSFEHSLHTF